MQDNVKRVSLLTMTVYKIFSLHLLIYFIITITLSHFLSKLVVLLLPYLGTGQMDFHRSVQANAK
jgi:hypothetical protein